MAKVHNNIFVRGLTGSVGDQFVIRKTRAGKTIVANKPEFDENREFSEAQIAQQDAFKKATGYAKGAKTQPMYVELAKGTDASAYNLAMKDWFTQPEILEVNTGGWTGGVGHTIRIRAQEEVQVSSVRVTIHQDGNVLEAGEAAPSETDGLLWEYVTTTNLTGTPNLQLDATAFDLPGNVGAATVSLN
jgi:hypothetical protein